MGHNGPGSRKPIANQKVQPWVQNNPTFQSESPS